MVIERAQEGQSPDLILAWVNAPGERTFNLGRAEGPCYRSVPQVTFATRHAILAKQAAVLVLK